MILDALHAKEAIASALYLEVCEQAFADPDEAARAFGIRPIGEKWRRLDRDTTSRVLLALLIQDMAFSEPRVPEDQARAASDEFLGSFGAGAAFFTNGKWEDGWTTSAGTGVSFGPEWEPVTEATFDGGVLVLDVARSGILWLEDED